MPTPRFISITLFLSALCVQVQAQWSDPTVSVDPHEVRLTPTWSEPDQEMQSRLRGAPFWSGFSAEHPRWQVQFDPSTGTIHRAFGPAIATEDAPGWLSAQVNAAGWALQTGEWREVAMGKHTLFRAHQEANGRQVLGTEFVVKCGQAGIISWGAQCHPGAQWPALSAPLSGAALEDAATNGISLVDITVATGEEWLLPVIIPGEVKRFDYRAVSEMTVSGTSPQGVPVQYRTLVDLEDGTVHLRQNQVKHIGHPHDPQPKRQVKPMGPPAWLQLLDVQITGTVHLTQPFESPVEVGLANLFVQTAQGQLTSSEGGMISLDGEMPQELGLQLQGLWSTVTTNDVTPSLDVVLQNDSMVSMDDGANIRELSAYHSVNRIHDHMGSWLTGFDGLDISMPTLVDVSGTCNAFYTPGNPTINFYSEGDGCNAFSLVSDVVFHEYGHGINDQFYVSQGGSFINGGINEGYADFWAISLTDNPVLGAGCYMENEDFFIRRYDIDPKVYPQDLVGQVHADGEIICGAWYDTHLLMGGDWNQTLQLFVDAYPGLQAETQNGNEGEAFVEILLDVLQADDDDDDLSNGTPNGSAILEGFGMHGISLFSSVDIAHTPDMAIGSDAPITLEAEAEILFPFGQYFSTCDLYYRTSPSDEWTQVPMTEEGGDLFSAELPAQEAGTVVDYFFGISDLFGATSAITPYSADDPTNPNLPFNLIVGLEPVLTDDQDDYSEFGFWELGLAGDNATTGEWESTIPVGSFSTPGDPSSICAPDEDHTPGDGLYAFITGVSPGQDAGIGSNDVDGGSTTLQTEALDLSSMVSPVLSYWRWYVNAPASGANPGADWWQVHISDDGGQNWVEVEETLTQDISWRRNAIALGQYIDLTDNVKLRFVASDSLRLNQELDGGSLIEAAVDDLIILDVATSGLAESESSGLLAWPVPAVDRLHSAGWQPGTEVKLTGTDGRLLAAGVADGLGQCHLDLSGLPTGAAALSGRARSGEVSVKKVVLSRK